MSKPALTLMIVRDNEKDPTLLWYALRGLAKLNTEPMLDGRVQVIVLNQVEAPRWRELARCQPFPVVWHECNHAQVNGAVVWDVIGALRDTWHMVEGDYWLMIHQECVLGPDYIVRALEWIDAAGRPPVVIGNMRRLGADRNALGRLRICRGSSSQELSAEFRTRLEYGSRILLEGWLEKAPTLAWCFWHDQQLARRTGWIEDIYWARRDFVEFVKLWWQIDNTPWQDIYDITAEMLGQVRQAYPHPFVGRLPESIRAYHLAHEKTYGHWCPEVREWLDADPERWAGTNYRDPHWWRIMLEFVTTGRTMEYSTANPTAYWKQAPGGPVHRFGRAFGRWLCEHETELAAWLAAQELKLS